MLCDDVKVNLPDYILGKIEPNLRKCIDEHLQSCARCNGELELLKEPIRFLGEAGVEEYPDAFWQELHASIMEQVSKPAPARWRVPAFAGGLAVVLVIVGIAILQYHPNQPTQIRTVTALASSLPAEQAVSLPMLNVNYVDAVSSQASEIDELDAVDDSLQLAVVKSMWNSVSDSTSSSDFDYLGNVVSN